MNIGDITGRIVIVDKGSAALSTFNRNFDVSVKQIQLSGNRLTSALEGMFSRVAVLATAGMVARKGFQFIKESTQEAIEAEKAMAQLRAGVESTGGAAGKSAEELGAMADKLSRLTGFDDELIAGGEAILLTFRRVRGEAFEQTMTLALDLSARFGKDVESSTIMIAKALDMLMAGSTKGLSALSKAGVTFTDQQKKQMEQLVRTGQAAEAQRIFFAELEAQFGGSAKAARNTMGGALQALEVAWSNLKEEIGSGGVAMAGVIERLTDLVIMMTDGVKLLHLGFTLALKAINDFGGMVEVTLRRVIATILEVQARLVSLNPFSTIEQIAKAEIAAAKARFNVEHTRGIFAERSRKLEADAYRQVGEILGILPKVKSNYKDIEVAIEGVRSKQQQWFDDLESEVVRQIQALDLLQQGMPVEKIENLVEAAQGLGKINLLDPLVIKAGMLKDKIDEITTAFKLADQAKQKFAEAGDDLNELIEKRFSSIGGSNDPEMQRLLDRLREAQSLTESIKTDEQRRLAIVARAQALYEQGLITNAELHKILLANADQWNVELDETQILFAEINDRLSVIADNIAFDLVSNWRRAWEENESITQATLDTLRDSILNVVQDIISEWLSAWFRAMAAWLARWIATQSAAKAASAGLGATGGSAGSFSGLFGMAGQAGGMSASTMMGAGLAAYGLFVIYKGFIEDHERKFARLTISDGAIGSISSHGKKYLQGVQQAAESIVNNIKLFLAEIDVTMTKLGTVILESSKSGFNVSLPGSTGKLFQSMEEAISYAQVLMLKYGEFADSVSLLVRSVIQSTKAIKIEDLASDIAFARKLETQNLLDFAKALRDAVAIAEADWNRAEDLFLSFYDSNLPAFAAAVDSILTNLTSNIWSAYNRLAGIEENPEEVWARKRSQYKAERAMIEAQLNLWRIEVEQRIANFRANALWLGGLGGVTRGTLGFAAAMVAAAEVLDPALQELYNILALINTAIAELPPLELPETDPGKKGKGGGKNRQQLREDLRDEIAALEAEAKGPLHSAFHDFNQQLASFRERAKEAKLPAEELAKGVQLLTLAFQRSIMEQARDRAGLETDFAKRLRDTQLFFDELEALGRKKTGIPDWLREWLEGQSFAKLGAELSTMINEFRGISDPMIAINLRAGELRQNLLAYAEAVGWSSDQINEALKAIDQGIEFQRQQGVNSLLDRLFGYLKEAGLYQQEALEHERRKALMDITLLEAQFRFYGALDSAVREWLDAAKDFINSDKFGGNRRDNNEPVPVRVTNKGGWEDIVEKLRTAINAWREGIDQFAESTRELMTDENLTNLTQAQQLEYARSQLEMLIGEAKGGDLEALGKLSGARAEFLRELRESEAGGFGFQRGFEWVMGQTADILSKAQEGEQSLIAKEMAKTIQAWSFVMDQLKDDLVTTLYETTDQLVRAIYDAIGGVPSLASGGIVMRGPRLVRVAEFVPEAIVPLDRLAHAIPYSNGGSGNGKSRSRDRVTEPSFTIRDSLARLTAIEISNERSARALEQVKSDISAMRRKGN